MVQTAEGREAKDIPAEGILPPGSPGHPRDIAMMVLYLASDESRFVTGAEMVVDNGVTIRPF